MRQPVILVVDDEALLRMLASGHFEDAGFEVIEASNGAQAIEILRARPDVRAIFTDVHMPGTPNGIALARHVRDVRPDCAIVIVSGLATPDGDELAEGARFVTKPYTGASVVSLVQEMLAR